MVDGTQTLWSYFVNVYFFKCRKYIPQRGTMSFPEGLFWATAEKPIFKYMKYAIQHEKQIS